MVFKILLIAPSQYPNEFCLNGSRYRQVGSKEAYDPRRGDASRVAELVVLPRELLVVGDSLVDGEREREHDDEQRRDVAVGARADGQRDGERAAATRHDDGGPAVHHVPIVQGPQVRPEDLHDVGRQHRQRRRRPRGEEQTERQREQSRASEQHADSDVEARINRRHRREPRSESRRLRHVLAADIVKSGLRQPLLNALSPRAALPSRGRACLLRRRLDSFVSSSRSGRKGRFDVATRSRSREREVFRHVTVPIGSSTR